MNKVTWVGLFVAILTSLIPVLQGESITLYTILFSVAIAALSVLTKNFQGQVWTILGIVLAALINYFTAHPEPGTAVDLVSILRDYVFPLLIQIGGAYAGSGQTKKE